jgi:hypothetical protein
MPDRQGMPKQGAPHNRHSRQTRGKLQMCTYSDNAGRTYRIGDAAWDHSADFDSSHDLHILSRGKRVKAEQ